MEQQRLKVHTGGSYLESWRTVMHAVWRVETGDGSQGALTGEGPRPIIKIRSLEITNQHWSQIIVTLAQLGSLWSIMQWSEQEGNREIKLGNIKRCDTAKIVSLFRSNDALGISQLFEDATKIKVHGIIWQMAGFRVAGVTLVPLCVKLEIQHSQPIGIILKPNTDFSLSCPVFVSIFSDFYIFVTQSAKKGHEQTRSQGECSHFTWLN